MCISYISRPRLQVADTVWQKYHAFLCQRKLFTLPLWPGIYIVFSGNTRFTYDQKTGNMILYGFYAENHPQNDHSSMTQIVESRDTSLFSVKITGKLGQNWIFSHYILHNKQIKPQTKGYKFLENK